MAPWTANDIPDQTGRLAVVTGASSGIGLETAKQLALRGARVLLAVRDAERGRVAMEAIARAGASGPTTVALLDLADLDSVAAFARRLLAEEQRLDLLIHNAGVMGTPLTRTRQGFELQVGVNHLGHFALGAHLLPLLLSTPGARLVAVASSAQRTGRIDLDDLNWERRRYGAWAAYCQSKLANMMHVLELNRRLRAAGADVRAAAAHPGLTVTDLQRHSSFFQRFTAWFGMRPEQGALPTLRAAVDPAAQGGSYWGPSGFQEMGGPPVPARIPRQAQDPAVAAGLWALSERLTGLRYPLGGA